MTPENPNFEASPAGKPETPKRSSRLSAFKRALAATVFAAAAGGLLFSYETAAQVPHAATPGDTIVPHEITQGAPFSFADLVQKVSPAVVTVVVEHHGAAQVADQGEDLGNVPSPFGDLFRQFGQGQDQGQGQGRTFRFGQRGGQGQQQQQRQPQLRSEARGAGFIIDGDGYIVTNNHVVDGGDKVTVHLPDGREFIAKVVGTDKDTDVALLKVDAHNLPTVAFGDDRRVRVGDWVVAVGNPFGLGGTVTAGIVSSIGRDIGNGPYTDYIQIDAPINQGNSGGPTFDLTGRVVGMNTAIYSPSGGSVGIGFAIPSSTVRTIVDQLKEHGQVTRGWLGVQIQSLTPEMAASLGEANEKGAIVASVVDNSPAEKAGLHQGDVVVALNGTPVDDSRDLTRKVALLSAGAHADFTVMRDGHKQTVAVTIGKRDEQVASNDNTGGPRLGGGPRASGENMLGMQLAPVTPDTRDQFGLKDNAHGVVVTSVDPDSDAADKGLHPGDVIVKIGDHDVRNPGDIRQSVSEAKTAGRKNVLMLVQGEGGQHFLTVKIA